MLRAEWWKFYLEPTATRSSKPESVQNEIAKKREKQIEKASRFALGGYVQALCVMNQAGTVLFSQAAPTVADAGALARNFVLFANSLPAAFELTPLPDSIDCRCKWFAFDCREVLHQLALTAIAADADLDVPVGMWYHRNFEPAPFIDPYEALVPTSLREDVDVYALYEFLGGQPLTANDVQTPTARAELARQLVTRSKLCHLIK